MNRKLVTPELTINCLMQTIFNDRKSDTEISSLGGVFQRSALAVGNNSGSKISCCFFSDILKFCSPLAYIPIYYHSIGRQVTKGHTKICFGATFRLDDETAKSK